MKQGACWQSPAESMDEVSGVALGLAEGNALQKAQKGDRPKPLASESPLRLVNGSAELSEHQAAAADPDDMLPRRFPPSRESQYLLPRSTSVIRGTLPLFPNLWPNQREEELVYEESPREVPDDQDTHTLLYAEPGFREKTAAVDRYAALAYRRAEQDGSASENSSESSAEGAQGVIALPLPAPVPAWLNHGTEDVWEQTTAELNTPGAETLQSSSERVASQRFAARSPAADETAEGPAVTAVTKPSGSHIPLLAVFSLTGGVGKTSLVATLGRALSHLGERVLLVDTTSQGLLPFYFGGGDLRPSVVRSAPPGAQRSGGERFGEERPHAERSGAPVDLVSLDVLGQEERNGQKWFHMELSRAAELASRILVDTSMPAPWMVRLLTEWNACIVVPVAPDMNSVITLRTVEEYFAELQSELGQAVQPMYLLNGFDASQPLHLDVRELLRQQLGERLLPFVIRRSQAISDALAGGTTVIDSAASPSVVADYLDAARWVRTHAGGMPRLGSHARWSEA